MDSEIWFSETFGDYIVLRKEGDSWQGSGEGFQFHRETKDEAVELLELWGYTFIERIR